MCCIRWRTRGSSSRSAYNFAAWSRDERRQNSASAQSRRGAPVIFSLRDLTSSCSLSPLSSELSREFVTRHRRMSLAYALQNPSALRRIGPPHPRLEILLCPQGGNPKAKGERKRKENRRGVAAPPSIRTNYAAGLIFFIRSSSSLGDTSST